MSRNLWLCFARHATTLAFGRITKPGTPSYPHILIGIAKYAHQHHVTSRCKTIARGPRHAGQGRKTHPPSSSVIALCIFCAKLTVPLAAAPPLRVRRSLLRAFGSIPPPPPLMGCHARVHDVGTGTSNEGGKYAKVKKAGSRSRPEN